MESGQKSGGRIVAVVVECCAQYLDNADFSGIESASKLYRDCLQALNDMLVGFNYSDNFEINILLGGTNCNEAAPIFSLPDIQIKKVPYIGLRLLTDAGILVNDRIVQYGKDNRVPQNPVIIYVTGNYPTLISDCNKFKPGCNVLGESLKKSEASIYMAAIGYSSINRINTGSTLDERIENNLFGEEVYEIFNNTGMMSFIKKINKYCVDENESGNSNDAKLMVFGAKVIGSSHMGGNIPCQDAFQYEMVDYGRGLIVVADGVGSASLSEIGAQTAVAAVAGYLKSALQGIKSLVQELPLLALNAMTVARDSLEGKMTELGCGLSDLACTLIIVILYERKAIVAHIGDGAVVMRCDNEFIIASLSEDSEYTNEVIPVTSSQWEKSIRISKVFEGVELVAAFTDGCQRAVLKKGTDGIIPFKGFFEPLYLYAEGVAESEIGDKNIKELLISKKMSESSDDDKTLVVGIYQKKV